MKKNKDSKQKNTNSSKNPASENRSNAGETPQWFAKHRILRNSLIGLAVLVVAGMGAGGYEYYQLMPSHHFQNLKVIGQTSNSTRSSNSTSSTFQVPKEQKAVFNMLLIGSDARPGNKFSHSDSMLLIHVNLNTHTYNILSLPRDTRVYDPGYGYTKLTSVQFMDQVKHGTKQGIIDAVKTISNLTGVPINFYAETDYWGLQDMVNAIGGINMYVPFKVTINHAWYPKDNGKVITKGMHFLNGRMVTELVHIRDGVPGTDYGRQKLQEQALIGIAKDMLKPKNIPKLPSLARTLPKFLMATNMTSQDMLSLAMGVKSDFHPTTQIHYRQVKGKNELIYDAILQAKNDEIVLNKGQLKRVVKQYFSH
ncbi:LCP family protein [Alicyclobacillus sp. SO9]|uniref:LCP family glycopolymer transferase n=1 Tax=Alicyclobacillus sp. SO9 TaxID=2665646 RepID=UPI0018E84B6A|nr:LCP family protein [Alicyclobacillus sp. SO9]QQE79120.1 LCP family protein [Alicyclobacillus sp. SO9]